MYEDSLFVILLENLIWLLIAALIPAILLKEKEEISSVGIFMEFYYGL